MNPDAIQDAIAGDDPFLQALRRGHGLLAGMPGAADVVRTIMSQPKEEWSMVIKFNAVFEAALIIMVSSIATLAGLHDLKKVHAEKRERDQHAAEAWDKFLAAVASVAQESVSHWLIPRPNRRPTAVLRPWETQHRCSTRNLRRDASSSSG